MNEQYIDFLAEELEREKLVIFVGAGVSRNSGLPSWQQLVEVFAKKLGINKSCFSPEETLQIPQIFYDEFSKIKYYEILQEVFEGTYEPNSIHKTLKKMNISHIITTNYDELIEKELNESKEYDVIGKEEELAYSKSTKMIIKMHGDMKYRNVVLKQEDYDDYEKNFPLISTYVKSLFTTNTIMFIGYSLNDVNVKNIMKWISNILNEDFRKVYLVTFDEKENNNILIRKKHENDKLVNRISLNVVNNNYEKSLNNFLEDIINKRNEKKEEKNRKFYKELNFLDKEKLEKLLKYKINLFQEYYDDGFIKEQELQIDIGEDKLEEKLEDYKENLIKSKIKKINGKAINEIFKDKKEIEESQEEENKNDKILKSIITYDKEKFIQLAKENFDLKNKWLLVFGYNFFQEHDEAINLIKMSIKEYKEKNLEKLIWSYYLYLNTQKDSKKVFKPLKENLIDLKDICKKYLKYNEKISSEKQIAIIQETLYNKNLDDIIQNFEKVLEALNGIACQKYSFSTTLEVLIDNILALFLNNFVTDEFKQKLKELNNENFKYYIEVRDYKDILEYALNKENFDLNNFQEKDLRFFTKIGIKELLKKGKEYQDFMKMISSYSKENNDRISETYIEFLEEQLTTKGDN